MEGLLRGQLNDGQLSLIPNNAKSKEELAILPSDLLKVCFHNWNCLALSVSIFSPLPFSSTPLPTGAV